MSEVIPMSEIQTRRVTVLGINEGRVQGTAWQGAAWRGQARRGKAWRGGAWRGMWQC